MLVLVTGSTGYLGNKVYNLLKHTKHKIIGTSKSNSSADYSVDFTNSLNTKFFFEEINPDKIIHCAAFVPKAKSDYHNKELSRLNVKITKNILSFSKCPIIFTSSMAVYGENIIPHKENSSSIPISDYGKSKARCEDLIAKSNRKGFAVRLPGLFGLPRKNGIIYNLINAKKNNLTYKMPDYPLLWSALSVNDAAKSIADLTSIKNKDFEKINIGYPDKLSINVLLETLDDLFGYKFSNDVTHPFFQFDLNRSIKYKVNPKLNFKKALITFYDQI